MRGQDISGEARTAMQNNPKSKTGQLADILRARIQAGDWAAGLPAERILAMDYFVSRTTLREALRILTLEGLLIRPEGTRRGHRVATRIAAARLPTGAGEAVILTPSLRDSPVLLEQLAILRQWLGKLGIPVHVRESARLTEEANPAKSLSRWKAAGPDTVWILHKMPRTVQQASHDLGLKALVFGSAFPGITIPFFDIDFRAVARHAAGRCLAHGHRKLAVLVHRTSLAGDGAVIESITGELARCGAPPPMILKHDFNRSRLLDAIDQKILPAASRPDALIVVNQHHLLTAYSHLFHRGLRIPKDISLIYLSNDPTVERLSPLPDRYDLGDRLLRRLAKATQARLAGELPVSSCLLPRMIKGETLA